MAQIDIEKKNNNKNNKGLYIIVAILVIAGIIWWAISLRNDDEDIEGQTIRPEVKVQPLPTGPEADPLEEESRNQLLALL